jgi:hypothetical protein
MPKPTPGGEPDPMARVVDRLLAQLPGLQGQHTPIQVSSVRGPIVVSGNPVPRRLQEPTQSEQIGVWVRVLLGLGLGIMMARWPYSRTCGLPLSFYLSAVITVMLAGGWGAAAAWKFRTGLAHIVSLILILYAITLASAELLPRSGYAIDRATWQCEETPSTLP